LGKTKRIILETTFSIYTTEKIIGEGGAGFVYEAKDESGNIVAAKILKPSIANNEKRKRFRNEVNFCLNCKHKNTVQILDHGVLRSDAGSSPFYIMPLYEFSLRKLIDKDIPSTNVLGHIAQIMDGVEAAHLLGTVHRDLKPENILIDNTGTIVVADFGIAQFNEDLMITTMETSPASRLANFQYAAPEQRVRGGIVDQRTDIYALGLILNEMYTKQIAIGTDYTTIGAKYPEYAYLDAIVSQMLRQNPNDRPANLEQVKREISVRSSEFLEGQKLSELKQMVVPESDIGDLLSSIPSRIVDFDWNHGTLTLFFDKPINPKWINALYNMGGYRSVWGKEPEKFHFKDHKAIIGADEHEIQNIINHFKDWLPRARSAYEHNCRYEIKQAKAEERNRVKKEIDDREKRLRILNNVKI
jgi:serine/threonine protein kinase